MLHLETLGGLSVASDTTALPPSAHQRQRLALLAVLAASQPRGVSRDRLAAYLWPESSAERAQHALDQLLYVTRRDLGRDTVNAEGGQLRLNGDLVRSDVAEFSAHLGRGELKEATALYGGPFLDGVHLRGGAELEQWVEAERRRLEEAFTAALETLGRQAAEAGDVQGAVDLWRKRAAVDRFSARGANGLVQALVRAGDRAGALQYARTYGALVRQELGVEPDPALLALAEQPVPQWDTRSTRTESGHNAAHTDEPAKAGPFIAPAKVEAETETGSRGMAEPGAETRSLVTADEAGTETGSLVMADEPGAKTASLVMADEPDVRAAGGKIIIPGGHRWVSPRRWKPVLTIFAAAVLLGSILVLPRSSTSAVTPSDATSLAVLPFEDLGADGSAEYLGDGMSEELIHALAQLPDLRVAARTSAFAFKGRHEDIREIARSLDVSTVLEGSVRREGDRLRVTAQLIDAASGHHLWSGRYDRRIGDALSIQDEISAAIVNTLRPQLTGQPAAPKAVAPASARAYHLYLQGRYVANQRTEAALRQAIRFFEDAIAEDPGYAAAYAGLADAHDSLVDGGFEDADAGYGRAEAAALRAIALDSTLAEAHAALGHLKFHTWDWAGSEHDLRRALELNPGYSAAYSYYAMPLVMQGRFDEGLAMMQKAQELNPLALNTRNTMGWLLFLSRRYVESIEQLRVVIAMDSTHVASRARLGLSLLATGRHEEGIASLERAVALGGDYHRSALPMLGYAYAVTGRREDAEEIRQHVERGLATGAVNPYYAAALMAALDNPDGAFALLHHTFDTSRGCLIDLGVDPMMDPLRRDERYAALVRALGQQPRCC